MGRILINSDQVFANGEMRRVSIANRLEHFFEDFLGYAEDVSCF